MDNGNAEVANMFREVARRASREFDIRSVERGDAVGTCRLSMLEASQYIRRHRAFC